ncbi:hypothetical protein Trydic_g11120 [Trypoxylus dichotomus]
MNRITSKLRIFWLNIGETARIPGGIYDSDSNLLEDPNDNNMLKTFSQFPMHSLKFVNTESSHNFPPYTISPVIEWELFKVMGTSPKKYTVGNGWSSSFSAQGCRYVFVHPL